MEFIYDFNALPFLNKRDLLLKDYLIKRIEMDIQDILREQNKAWQFVQIEAPCLIPQEYINQNYTEDDIWMQQTKNHSPLALKPETTPVLICILNIYSNNKRHYHHCVCGKFLKVLEESKISLQNIADTKSFTNKSFSVYMHKIQKMIINTMSLNHWLICS